MTEKKIFLDLTLSVLKLKQNAFGVLRVEREIAKTLLQHQGPVGFFAYSSATKTFHDIDKRSAAAIVGLEIPTEFSPDLTITNNGRLTPGNGDIVIAAGYLWDWNYLDEIGKLKATPRFEFMAVVYDIIPLLYPEFAFPGLSEIYRAYLTGLSDHADVLYSISNATSQDVTQYLRGNNQRVPQMRRIRLGSDVIHKNEGAPVSPSGQFPSGPFVLCVCTLEPRKNHALLFNIWRTLYSTNREQIVPLVIVGKIGFNTNDLLTMIGQCNRLYPEYIKIYCETTDSDLAWLYQNCLFSVYPSFYEGWGLPIAESLAYGKACLASSTSSMGEIAPGLVELIDPLDTLGWIGKVRDYLLNPHIIKQREDQINADYTPTRWEESTRSFLTSVLQDTTS